MRVGMDQTPDDIDALEEQLETIGTGEKVRLSWGSPRTTDEVTIKATTLDHDTALLYARTDERKSDIAVRRRGEYEIGVTAISGNRNENIGWLTEVAVFHDDVEADDQLRLTDEGIELPEFLKGYVGQFTLKTADVTGTFHSSDHGMPETDFYDGPIAVYPDDDGDYNPELAEGYMALGTPSHGEEIFEIIDDRTNGGDSA